MRAIREGVSVCVLFGVGGMQTRVSKSVKKLKAWAAACVDSRRQGEESHDEIAKQGAVEASCCLDSALEDMYAKHGLCQAKTFSEAP